VSATSGSLSSTRRPFPPTPDPSSRCPPDAPYGSVAVGYTPPARSAPLGSTFVDWGTLSFRPSPVGLYCSIFDDRTAGLEKLEVHVTTLRPGMASHSPHHHAWEELLLIK